jgi:hypothetical protein
VSSGTTTVLSVTSPHYISVSGVSTQTIKLPNATLLTVGQSYKIDNNSSGNVYIQDATGAQIGGALLPGAATEGRVINVGTTAGTWDGWNYVPGNVSFGTSQMVFTGGTIVASTFTGSLVGTATTATYAQSFNTATLVTTAVSATTATNAGYAYSFNTNTVVTTAVTATNAGYAYSFNTSTLVLKATTATLAQTVTAAAQPAITSVGTLTSLSLQGSITFNDATTQSTAWTGSTYRIIKVADGFGVGLPFQSYVTADTSTGIIVSALTGIPASPTYKTWTFGFDGVLTFPDNSTQTVAWNTSTAVYYSQIRNAPSTTGTAVFNIVSATNITVGGTTIQNLFSVSTATVSNTATSLVYNTSTGVYTFTPFSLNTSTLMARAVTVTSSTQAAITALGTLTSLSVSGASTVSGLATFNYTGGGSTSTISVSGQNSKGGALYHDFLSATNGLATATNATKYFRLNNVGTLEILNSAYNATVFSVTDNGYIAINAASGVSNGLPGNNAIAMNNNSYIYDDGNYHLTSKSGSIWINANGGNDVNINTQVPSGTMPGGLNVQGAITSQGSGTAATSFISGVNAYSGVALQLTPNGTGAANQAIRDTSSAASTMYFDVNTGGSAHGQFQFRSSNAFSQLLVVSNSAVTVNRQMLIGGGSQGAYVTINGTNTYNINGPFGYLNGGGAGAINSSGSTGNQGFSLQCSGRIQANEVDVPSDERLKDIQGTIPLDKALQFVRAVDGILYTWKPGFGDNGLKSGFNAQGVYKAGFDHMVVPVPNDRVAGSTDADGFTSPDKFQLSLNYQEAIPYHHEVIKHLLDRIEQLEATVAKLTK